MFEAAEVGATVDKHEYRELEPRLRRELLKLQRELQRLAHAPVIIVFAGVDGAGKGQTINLLNKWMDPRWLVTRAYQAPSDEERERPEFWRFWRDLPPKGRIGLFLSSWYSRPLLERVHDRIDEVEFSQALDRIVAFEDTLAEEGAVILKFWMHLSKPAQVTRLEALEHDPLTRWRVSRRDWQHCKLYDTFISTAERIISRTSTGRAPWRIVEGVDANHRYLAVGTALRDALHAHIETLRTSGAQHGRGKPATKPANNIAPTPPATTILGNLDMTLQLARNDYRQQLRKYHASLSKLCRKALDRKVSTILVFEGPDAAGKGGGIRRVIEPLDARNYQVLPFAAPTDEERAHHYLWRFWRHMSRHGRLTIYDRSWYGRVLVERVEELIPEETWRRAYAEINAFEDQLIEHGILLVKFWVHITRTEQLDRFRIREQTPHKRWKLTEEDWRNHHKWDEYEQAAHDMVQHTSTAAAPWNLVEGNDKRYARIKILSTVCEQLKTRLNGK